MISLIIKMARHVNEEGKSKNIYKYGYESSAEKKSREKEQRKRAEKKS